MPNMGFRGVYAGANSAIGGRILSGDILPAIRGGFYPSYLIGSIGSTPLDTNFNYTTLLVKATGSNTQQNYTFLDSSTNNFTVTRNGDVTQGAFSPYGIDEGKWSVYFDGTGDYFTAGSSVSLSGDFTVEGWVYINSRTTEIFLYGLGNDLNPTAATFFVATTGYLRVYTNNSHLLSGTSVAVGLNQWTHVAFVRNSNVLRAYINGVLVDTSGTWSSSLTGVSYINAELNGNAQTVYPGGSCYISNLRVATNVVYSSAFTPPTTNLTSISGTSLLVCQSNRFKDNSTNNATITRNGDTKVSAFTPFNQAAVYATATNGGSLYFDGTGDTLTIASSTPNQFGSGDFTIETWYYCSGAISTSGQHLFFRRTTVSALGLIFQVDNSKLNLLAGDTNFVGGWEVNISSTTTLTANRWYHLAMSRSGSSWKIFVDGVQEASINASFTIAEETADITIGTNITGYLSNLRVVKGTAVYTSAFTPPTAPVTAIAGTSLLINGTNAGIIDASRKSHLYTTGNAQVRTDVIKYDKSIAFDGTGDYLLIPSASYTDEFLFGSSDFTVETWVRFTSFGGNRCIIDAWVSGQSASWQLYYQSASTKIVWYVGNGVLLTSTTTPLVDTWYHVAVTRSGTVSRMFINGVTEATEPSTSPNYNYKAPLALGVQYSTLTNYLNGYMEDTRITKGIARYTAGFTPPTAPLPTA